MEIIVFINLLYEVVLKIAVMVTHNNKGAYNITQRLNLTSWCFYLSTVIIILIIISVEKPLAYFSSQKSVETLSGFIHDLYLLL